MCSAPLTVSGGVSIENTSSRGLVRSNLYYTPLFPPARPFLLDAVKRRLARHQAGLPRVRGDRKSTRLNSSHLGNSYAVFTLEKKGFSPEAGRFMPFSTWIARAPGRSAVT